MFLFLCKLFLFLNIQKSGCNNAKNGINSNLPINILEIHISLETTVKPAKFPIGPSSPNAGPTLPRLAIALVKPIIASCSINTKKGQLNRVRNAGAQADKTNNSMDGNSAKSIQGLNITTDNRDDDGR